MIMRLSTLIKHKYQEQGITVLRAIRHNNLIRVTVPLNTPRLAGEVKRMIAYNILGHSSKAKEWIWVTS
jgi:hypothetical protein